MDLYFGNLMLPSLKNEAYALKQLNSISRVYMSRAKIWLAKCILVIGK